MPIHFLAKPCSADAEAHENPQIGRIVNVRGRSVHVLIKGQGTPVLLLHGNGGLGEEVLAPLEDRGPVTWIAPDRPGYGFTQALPKGKEDPRSQAVWLEDLLDALDLPAVHVVAHSIGSGPALYLASQAPHRVLSLTLISPFCRPSRPRWKPGLRLAAAPVVGELVRPVVPHIVAFKRDRVLAHLAAPNAVPPTLQRMPITHALQPSALVTIAAELRSFNDGMKDADPHVDAAIPVVAVVGEDDPTAPPHWHLPWLRPRVANLTVHRAPKVGHMLHHVQPDLAWQAVQEAIGGVERHGSNIVAFVR